jgi:hypothetical protein
MRAAVKLFLLKSPEVPLGGLVLEQIFTADGTAQEQCQKAKNHPGN